MGRFSGWLACVLIHSMYSFLAIADDGERFAIHRFHITGNQLINDEQLQRLVTPYTGNNRTATDVREAQRAIEGAYLAAGFGAVRAVTPEQEVTGGVVRIDVIEARIKRISVIGAKHFPESNIRASLPALREGETPNLRELSENVQLANENPAKRAEILLNSLGTRGELEARVLVKDEKPLRISASLDNSGNHATGRHRVGVALQHANLFDRDHVATLAYLTSPEKPEKVDIYSVSYRLPIYALGDSLDFIYGYSSVSAGVTQTVAGPLSFTGSGRVMGFRYNYYFPRQGEFSSRITFGIDQRQYDNSCDIGGISCGSADADVTVRPVSVTWLGQWQGSRSQTSAYFSLVHNLAGGRNGHDADFNAVRSGAKADYKLLRYGLSLAQGFAGGWQARAALNGQISERPLVPGEQLGIAGASSVRGFNERAVSVDQGIFVNLEMYSPNIGERIGLGDQQSIRGLLFADAADGSNRNTISGAQIKNVTLASVGLGLRAEWSNRASLRLDIARVVRSHEGVNSRSGDVRGHFALNVLF